QARRDLRVGDLDAGRAEGAEGDLGCPGDAELAYDERVERQVECVGDGDGHRYPAADEAEHDRGRVGEGRQALGEDCASRLSVGVAHPSCLRSLVASRETTPDSIGAGSTA